LLYVDKIKKLEIIILTKEKHQNHYLKNFKCINTDKRIRNMWCPYIKDYRRYNTFYYFWWFIAYSIKWGYKYKKMASLTQHTNMCGSMTIPEIHTHKHKRKILLTCLYCFLQRFKYHMQSFIWCLETILR
jgi:hypothetical protein